jgi:hypothetical protein
LVTAGKTAIVSATQGQSNHPRNVQIAEQLHSANALNDCRYRMNPNGNNQSSPTPEKERLAYSIQEAADMLGVDYFSVYRLIQRGKLKA